MSIIRVEKTANYSIISNLCLRNEKISLKAKGLFSYIMTLPDNWKLNQSDLVNRFPDGRTAISSAMDELEAAGYIHKEKIRDCSGRMAGWVYTVYEHPVSPTSGFPTSVNPTSDNQPLVSTNREVNTNSSKDTCKFIEFWNAWPSHKRKVGKPQCESIWKSKHLDDKKDIVIAALEKFKVSRDWTKDNGQYIPMPAKWLRAESWEAEMVEDKKYDYSGGF